MKCLNCQSDTDNDKFCSRRCAAIYNNKLYVKRKKMQPVQRYCKKCGDPIPRKRRKICDKCSFETREKILSITVGELKNSSKSKTLQNFHAIIRGYGKTIYESSGKPKLCLICGYSTHYEVCHIKSISSFDDSTTLRIVHDINNLVALCPNHHWEYDHGLVALPGVEPELQP